MPLPLSPDLWVDVVFAGRATEHGLVSAIAQSRDASLLYYGLLSLDEPTRAWIAARRPILAELAQHAAAFAMFAPGLRIAGDTVHVPGNEAARPVWEALVGQPTHNPEAFLRALLIDGNGRLGYFFGTISQLTLPQIELSLAPASLGARERVDAARRLYGVFERLSPGWRIGERIFQRPPLDPALLVADLRPDRDGRPILPGTRRFWSAVFDSAAARARASRDDDPSAISGEPPVDLAWLCDQIFSADADYHRRYYSVLFISRTLDQVTRGNARDAIDAARAVIRYPALIATLERAHVKNIAVLASAGRRAEQLSSIADEGRMVRAVAQFQAALALVTRAGLRGSLSDDVLSTWVASLSALEPDERGDYDGRVIKWLDERMHELGVKAVAAPGDLTDQNVLHLIAGPASPPPIVEWEGTRYRVDFTKAETTRLEQLLGDALPPYLSSARAMVGVADTLAADGLTADGLRAEVSVFDRAAHGVSLDVAEEWTETDAHARYRETDARLARAAQGADLRAAAHLAADLRHAGRRRRGARPDGADVCRRHGPA